MKKHLQINFLVFLVMLIFAGILSPISVIAQTESTSKIPARYHPLNPDRPSFLDLEVAPGTTKLVEREITFNTFSYKYLPEELIIRTLNAEGMITYYQKDFSVETGKVYFADYTYDEFNRLTKKVSRYKKGENTTTESVSIRYSGSNPLVAYWEVDTTQYYEKMYFDNEGIVIKKERWKALEDSTSITRRETYDPVTQKGRIENYYGSDYTQSVDRTYDKGRLIKEVADNHRGDFISRSIILDENGNVIQDNNRYTIEEPEHPYLEKKLTYTDGQWVAALHTIDVYSGDDEIGFVLREITNATGWIEASTEEINAIKDVVEAEEEIKW